MKISYNWLRQYIQTDLVPDEIAKLLTASGLEVEAVEAVESVKGGLQGVVVGEVLECEKHPDADRLRLTKVNIGQGEPLQIVCGAPNVAHGQKVLVATIGTKLYPSDGEPLTIKKGKIRGQESHGMICAEDELGIGKSHDGILVLNETAIPGTAAADYFGLTADFCFEIGLTPNRTDAFSHYGVARELFAILRNMQGIKNANPELKFPGFNEFVESKDGSGVRVFVHHEEGCPRYAGITLKNIKVAESPKFLKDALMSIGLKPVNNVVDITNFIQHELGQPLHAFDADKLDGREIHVRTAVEGEIITTLDGVERKLTAQDLVIADKSKPACIAGVFGGLESGVNETTTNIFLESAYFNPVFVRKTAKKHGIHTDSSFRFERGCDPEMVIPALKRAAMLMQTIAGAESVGAIVDLYPQPIESFKVNLSFKRCEALIGKRIEKNIIKGILADLDIKILSESEEALELSIPFFRTDVRREADVIEEILRIYGYDNIEIPTSLKASLSSSPKPDPEKCRNLIADMLTSNGFSEMMSMSLTSEAYSTLDSSTMNSFVSLLNPLSSDLGVLRQNLLFGGLEAIAMNQNHRNPDLRLYEFGKIYFQADHAFKEENKLAIFLTGKRTPESWNNSDDAVSFVDLKAAVDRVFDAAGLDNIQYSAAESSLLVNTVKCFSGKMMLGQLGIVNEELQKKFDIKQQVYFAELNWDILLKLWPLKKIQYKAAEKFPSVRRDLSLLVNTGISYADIENAAWSAENKYLKSVNLFDVYEGKNLSEGKKSYAISLALQDASKTMTDQQVDQIMTRIVKALEEKAGAEIRKG
jgi:phenylalanyl-tRNA synthetase beta chain